MNARIFNAWVSKVAVVSDTGPINYLFLIGRIDILPSLFTKILLSNGERRIDARAVAADWVGNPPLWIEISESRTVISTPEKLGAGEQSAIALAIEVGAGLILMDDRKGVISARKRGLIVTGTLGLLDLAARRNLLNFREAFRFYKRRIFGIGKSL